MYHILVVMVPILEMLHLDQNAGQFKKFPNVAWWWPAAQQPAWWCIRLCSTFPGLRQ